jgi:hypothetical protein
VIGLFEHALALDRRWIEAQSLLATELASPAHVSLNEGKASCFMSGPDQEAVQKAHEAVPLPFDSITEVKRVTGTNLRYPVSARAAKKSGVAARPIWNTLAFMRQTK